jgi:hypothetical protein
MRELEDHLELVITEDDVNVPGDWQLKDLESTMRPYAAQTRAIDAQMIEALKEAP